MTVNHYFVYKINYVNKKLCSIEAKDLIRLTIFRHQLNSHFSKKKKCIKIIYQRIILSHI